MGMVDDASSSPLRQLMETRLGSLKQHPESAIYRVPRNLKEVDPSAYEPMFVSIGPYHYTPALGPQEHVVDIDVRKRPKLQQGQDLKWHFLQDFLGRNDKVSLADYISLIQGSESDARDCYIEDVSLGSDEFNHVMLLDACFILEFFFKKTKEDKKKKKYHQHGNNLVIECVTYDLLLLENQLPIFILQKIYDRFREAYPELYPDSLYSMVMKTFDEILTCIFGEIEESLTRREESDESDSSTYYHLVHLVHSQLFQPRVPTQADNANYNYIPKIDRSASTLLAMGVKIVRPKRQTRLFEIEFNNGILELPHHSIFDQTGQILRNFIAFEQTSECKHHYFTYYAFFMDDIINTARDVEALETCGVLTSQIGSNEKVANLFNQIGLECFDDNSKNYLLEIETRLEEYCKIRRHRWRAKLVEDYFSNPWSILSLLAAIVLLVMTALQTIFTILN